MRRITIFGSRMRMTIASFFLSRKSMGRVALSDGHVPMCSRLRRLEARSGAESLDRLRYIEC